MAGAQICFNALAELKTIHARHHNVGYHKVDKFLIKDLQGLSPVNGREYFIVFRQIIGNKVEYLGVIINN